MNALTTSDFDKICRCCLSTLAWKQMVPLNSWHLELYCAITSLKFNTEDTLPKLICQQCTTKMRIIKNFATVCMESDKTLNSINKTVLVIPEVENEVEIVENLVEIVNISDSEEDTKDFFNEIDINTCNEEIVDSETIINDEGVFNHQIPVSHACDKCYKSFTDEALLEEHKSIHLTIHEKVKPKRLKSLLKFGYQVYRNACYTCKMKFKNPDLREIHYKNSVTCRPRRFVCQDCGKSFNQKQNLNLHQVIHSEKRNYSCSKCGKTFRHYTSMTWHEKIVHDKKKALKFICQFCAKGFPLPSHLKRHEQTHTEYHSTKKSENSEKPQISVQNCLCPVCGKTLCSKNSLALHVLTHTGEKPHKCPHCSKTFRHEGSLKTHINIHLGIRPYSCKVCYKSFTQNNTLKAHMLSHTGAKPHQCDICQNKFVSKANLRLHMLIHTGDKPIKCPHCGEGFADYKPRRVHVQQIHGISTSKKVLNEPENENT